MKHLVRIILLFQVMTLASWLAVDASAQSIAEFARRERERRRAAAEKTYTNSDIGQPAVTGQPAPASTPSVVAPAAATPDGVTAITTAGTSAAGAATAKPSGPVDNKGHDEKYWREQFAMARDAVRRAEDLIRVLEAKIAVTNGQMVSQSDLYNREGRLQAEIAATNTLIAAARVDADKARQKITALEEDLRRAGGPAGWAR